MNWIIAGCHCCIEQFIFHLIGGERSGPVLLADNDRYVRKTNSWTSETDLPSPARRLHGTVNIDGTIYNFCGQAASASKDNDSYVLDTWTAKTDAPTAKVDVRSGVIGSYGYCIAGFTGSYTDENAEYDPSGNSWTTKAVQPTPVKRAQASSFSADSGVFVALGFDSSYLTDNDKYESAGDSWAAKTSASSGKNAAGSMAISDKGYTVGGTTSSIGTTNVDEYDTAGDSWSSKTAIGYASQGNSAVGGVTLGYSCAGISSTTYKQNNEEYDQASDTWTAKSTLPSPARYQAGAAVLA